MISRKVGEERALPPQSNSVKYADILLSMLPPIVHIRKESDKAALRLFALADKQMALPNSIAVDLRAVVLAVEGTAKGTIRSAQEYSAPLFGFLKIQATRGAGRFWDWLGCVGSKG